MTLNGKRLARNRKARFERKAMELLTEAQRWFVTEEVVPENIDVKLAALRKSSPQVAKAVDVLLKHQ